MVPPEPTTLRVLLALILVGSVASPSKPDVARAATAASTVHILGDFNGWDTSLWYSDPGMTQTGSTWTGSVDISDYYVEQGFQQLKFVTDRAWDSPADYVLCPDRLDEYMELSGPVCLTPFGLNVQIYADVAGRYQITLDEAALSYHATLAQAFDASITGRIQVDPPGGPLPIAEARVFEAGKTLLLARAFSDPTTGEFGIEHLDGGTYDVRVSAPGHPEVEVGGVVVAEGGTVDIGILTLICITQWTYMQVVGDFNGWDANAPGMVQPTTCVWELTMTVPQGCYYMKFRTNNEWGDDYGTCAVQDPTCQVPLSGATCVVNGENALGLIEFPETDAYRFRLNEAAGTYQIERLTTPARRPSWGSIKVIYR